MDTTILTDQIKQIPGEMDAILNTIFLSALNQIWNMYWPIIIGMPIVAGVIIVIQLRVFSCPNRLPSSLNVYVGSVTRLFFATVTFFVFCFTLGPQVIDWEWMVLSGIIGYKVADIF